MSPNEQEIQERHFVEEFGLLYEELGGSQINIMPTILPIILDPPSSS